MESRRNSDILTGMARTVQEVNPGRNSSQLVLLRLWCGVMILVFLFATISTADNLGDLLAYRMELVSTGNAGIEQREVTFWVSTVLNIFILIINIIGIGSAIALAISRKGIARALLIAIPFYYWVILGIGVAGGGYRDDFYTLSEGIHGASMDALVYVFAFATVLIVLLTVPVLNTIVLLSQKTK